MTSTVSFLLLSVLFGIWLAVSRERRLKQSRELASDVSLSIAAKRELALKILVKWRGASAEKDAAAAISQLQDSEIAGAGAAEIACRAGLRLAGVEK